LSFIKVAETSEIPLGQMKAFKFVEKQVLIANVKGIYYVIGSICTHRNVELSEGTLERNIVTCPNHKAKFDVTTGKVISGPRVFLMHPKIKDEPAYAVKVEGKDILLERDSFLVLIKLTELRSKDLIRSTYQTIFELGTACGLRARNGHQCHRSGQRRPKSGLIPGEQQTHRGTELAENPHHLDK
jgi:3-phenylpropionate/trans-cinnamate dioxygenase ferredoxin subunit